MLSRHLLLARSARVFSSAAKAPAFAYQPLFDLAPDTTTQYVSASWLRAPIVKTVSNDSSSASNRVLYIL